jgi:hypothetical protein
MEEAIGIRVERIELNDAIEKIKVSIKDVERVNKDI